MFTCKNNNALRCIELYVTDLYYNNTCRLVMFTCKNVQNTNALSCIELYVTDLYYNNTC